MSTSPKNSDATPTPPDRTTVILLLGTIGSTTWRMFVPIIGLTIAGVYGDNMLATKPWLTIAGITLGIIIAGFLVKDQIKKVKK
jgi:hypothetical protein